MKKAAFCAGLFLVAFLPFFAHAQLKEMTVQEEPATEKQESGADYAALLSTLSEIRDKQSEILALQKKDQSRLDRLEDDFGKLQQSLLAVQRPGLSDLKKAQQLYAASLEQGMGFWTYDDFKINPDGTATLRGRGTAYLDSGAYSNNAGGGAVMYVTFTDLQDPVFLKCRGMLEKTTSIAKGTTIEISGQGTYETAKARPDHSNDITAAFAFRLGKLSKCTKSKF